jgi:ElaB/YqjD/DUF883 family membrane-anchored ribosome-binding protein
MRNQSRLASPYWNPLMNPDKHAIEQNATGNGSSVASTVAQASSGAHHAIDKAAEAARPAVEQIASGAHHAVDRLAGAANSAADSIGHRSDQVRDLQQQLSDSCRSYVRDKPIASLGIAVAVGFALSWVLRHR